MVSTKWSSTNLNSTKFSADFASLNGIIMDDTVALMDDSTYTLDDATDKGGTGIESTNWTPV